MLESFAKIDLPIPPMLLKAVGYPERHGSPRFVGLCWIPWGDESYYLDGQLEGTGDPRAYIEYFDHPKVRDALQQYDLGSSDSEPAYIFVIDRHYWQAYIASMGTARQFLRDQWGNPSTPTGELIEITKEDLQEFVESFQKVTPPTPEEIQATHIDQAEKLKELKFWIKENL